MLQGKLHHLQLPGVEAQAAWTTGCMYLAHGSRSKNYGSPNARERCYLLGVRNDLLNEDHQAQLKHFVEVTCPSVHQRVTVEQCGLLSHSGHMSIMHHVHVHEFWSTVHIEGVMCGATVPRLGSLHRALNDDCTYSSQGLVKPATFPTWFPTCLLTCFWVDADLT